MSLAQSLDKDYLNRAVDVSIRIGLLILLAAFCFQILRPFFLPIVWGIIIAIAVHPAYLKIKSLCGEHGTIAAVLVTLLFLAAIILPTILLAGTLVDGIHTLAADIKDGTLSIPSPPARIEGWPVIGPPLADLWNLASTNLTAVMKRFAPQIKTIIPGVLSISAGIALTFLELVLSILIGGIVLANSQRAERTSRSLANRLFGNDGQEFHDLVASTIRRVTTGILGVAFLQSVFAAIGFLVVGLPGAGLWGVIFLVAAVLQFGAIVLIPAVIYIFAVATTTKAVLFLIWCVIVGLMDNVLKPILLGRGLDIPMAVVFLGSIGGFLFMGLIGLFIGAVVLSVGYKLLLAWLEPVTAHS